MKKLLLLLAFCGTVQAATQGLNITGTVSSQCAFASVTDGTFGFEIQTPHILDTALTGGTDASVVIYYNGTPSISLPEITSFSAVPSGFSDTVNFTNTFTSNNAGTITYSSGSAAFQENSGTSTDALTLRLRAINANGSFPVGTYTASSTITCQ